MMTTTGDSMTAVPRRVAGLPDAGELRDWAADLVDRARTEGVELTGDNGLLTALVRQVLQTGLEVEMTEHMGYEPHTSRAAGRATAATVITPRRSRLRWVRSSSASPRTATRVSSRSRYARVSAVSTA
jgi:transposase-like protein